MSRQEEKSGKVVVDDAEWKKGGEKVVELGLLFIYLWSPVASLQNIPESNQSPITLAPGVGPDPDKPELHNDC